MPQVLSAQRSRSLPPDLLLDLAAVCGPYGVRTRNIQIESLAQLPIVLRGLARVLTHIRRTGHYFLPRTVSFFGWIPNHLHLAFQTSSVEILPDEGQYPRRICSFRDPYGTRTRNLLTENQVQLPIVLTDQIPSFSRRGRV